VLRGSSGIEAILRVETADDHGKNTHLCESDYTVVITRAGKTTTDQHSSSDGEWNRLISFRLAGFSQDQTILFGIFYESDEFPTVQIFAYHVNTQVTDTAELNHIFPRAFSNSCLVSLSVIGTTPASAVVLSSEASPQCTLKARWSLHIPSDHEVSRARALHHSVYPRARILLRNSTVTPIDSEPAEAVR
jgi:hypothetical protein